jgi:hypothetical protein
MRKPQTIIELDKITAARKNFNQIFAELDKWALTENPKVKMDKYNMNRWGTIKTPNVVNITKVYLDLRGRLYTKISEEEKVELKNKINEFLAVQPKLLEYANFLYTIK